MGDSCWGAGYPDGKGGFGDVSGRDVLFLENFESCEKALSIWLKILAKNYEFKNAQTLPKDLFSDSSSFCGSVSG